MNGEYRRESVYCTWIHLGSLGLSWFHLGSLGLIWTHLVPLGLTTARAKYSIESQTLVKCLLNALTWYHLFILQGKRAHLIKREKGKLPAPKGKRESVIETLLHRKRLYIQDCAYARTNGTKRFPGFGGLPQGRTHSNQPPIYIYIYIYIPKHRLQRINGSYDCFGGLLLASQSGLRPPLRRRCAVAP